MDIPAPDAHQCVIGVAIALPDSDAARVRQVRAAAGDPLAHVIPPHITILPPTAVDVGSLEQVSQHLRRVARRTSPFRIRLDEVGTFRPVSPVVYLDLSRGAPECDRLQGRVRDEAGPLARPLSFPFHPHVTLAHEIADDHLDVAAAAGAELDVDFTAPRGSGRLRSPSSSVAPPPPRPLPIRLEPRIRANRRLPRSRDSGRDGDRGGDRDGTRDRDVVIARIKGLIGALQRTRPGRALKRYGTARGALMAGGIAYTAMFSIFAALVIGMSTLMAMIGNRPAFRAATISSVDSMLPGVLDTGDGQGLVTVEQLTLSSALNFGSVIAGVALLYSAMSLMGTIKTALRAMFGIVNPPPGPVVSQLLNLLGFLVIVAGVLVTAVASVVTTTLSGGIGRRLGLPDSLTGSGAWLATLAVSFIIDAGVLAMLITVCGVRPPKRDLIQGCMLGALALGVLRQVGTGAVGSAAVRNPLLASFAAVVVLVLWLHLTSRAVLLAAAWTANPPLPREVEHPAEVHAHERPNYVTLSVPETLTWPRQSLTGALEADPTARPDYSPLVSAEQRE